MTSSPCPAVGSASPAARPGTLLLPIIAALVLPLGSGAGAATLVVPDDFPTIGAAIAASGPGDSVLVQPGTYVENLVIVHDLSLLALGPGTVLDGGGVLTTSVVRVRAPARVRIGGFRITRGGGGVVADSGTELWLEDATIACNGGSCYDGYSGPGGVMAALLHAVRCRIEGNTGGWMQTGGLSMTGGEVRDCLIAGNGSGFHPICAGGCGGASVSSTSGVLFERTRFEGNATDGGPAALCGGGPITLRDCEFVNHNLFHSWCVVALSDGPVTIERCRFAGTTHMRGGPVLALYSPTFHIAGSSFVDNTQGFIEEVVLLDMSAGTVADCLFARNTSIFAAGIHARQCDLTVVRSTFTELQADQGAAALYTESGSLAVEHSIFASTSGGPAVRCSEGAIGMADCNDLWATAGGGYAGCPPGPHDLAADPLFCDPAASDYSLRADSPCVPPQSPPECGLIGAFGVGCGVLALDGSAPPAGEARLRIAPNPVWLEAQLTVGGVRPGSLVDIIDTAGRVIEVLRPEATGVARWLPPRHVPSGVYFARLRGDEAGPARFVLIR